MEKALLNNLIKSLPLAYAYHRILLDKDGFAEDYVFLDINAAFERMTGLKTESTIGRKATEVIPGLRNDSMNWIEFYGKIAISGESKEFTQFSEALGRWYKVTAFSPEVNFFVTVFQDITAETEQRLSLERQQKQLRLALRDFEIIFNGTLDPISLFEYRDGRFVYIRNNLAHQKLTGLDLRVKGEMELLEVFGEETGKQLQRCLELCVQNHEPTEQEMTINFPSGSRRWDTTLIPVFEGGEIQYIVASSRDITEVETLRLENEGLLERLKAMFDEHMAIMMIIDPLSGRIKDANPSACDFYGYTKDELTKMHIQDINLLPPEVVEQYRMKALKEKQRYFVFPHRLKSGEVRMVDVYSSPIKGEGGAELFSILFDVTERERLKEELYREKELLKITLESIGDGVVTTDINGRITSLNEPSSAITGWSEPEAKGRPFEEVFILKNEITGETVDNPVEKVLRTGKIIGLANHTFLVNRDGRHISIADSAAPIVDASGNMFGVVMVFRDVSAEREQQERIFFLSYHDELTGLFNRRYAEEAMKRMSSSDHLPLAIIMGDLNGLKITNDVFGHAAGDSLLKRAADILRSASREDDVVARWGGDEFLMLLPRTTAETAKQIMDKIKAECAAGSEDMLKISIALGCGIKNGEEDVQSVLQEAEDWMYHQKLLDDKSYKKAIIKTLLSTLYEKSYETEKHDVRMNQYCAAIGKKLGLSDENLNELSLFAILHDIGKIGVNQSILQKPGPLNHDEWEEMRRHPEIGFRIAQNTPELATVANYILSHHERWDGKGYPQGLEGENIPLLCRILSVADAFDAMTNDRVYRKAISKEEALEELMRNSGTQFDPKIVRIFVDLVSGGGV